MNWYPMAPGSARWARRTDASIVVTMLRRRERSPRRRDQARWYQFVEYTPRVAGPGGPATADLEVRALLGSLPKTASAIEPPSCPSLPRPALGGNCRRGS